MKLSEKLTQCVDHNAKQDEYYNDAKWLEGQVEALQNLDILNKEFGASKIAMLEAKLQEKYKYISLLEKKIKELEQQLKDKQIQNKQSTESSIVTIMNNRYLGSTCS